MLFAQPAFGGVCVGGGWVGGGRGLHPWQAPTASVSFPHRLDWALPRLSGLTAPQTVDDPRTPPRRWWEGDAAVPVCPRALGSGGGGFQGRGTPVSFSSRPWLARVGGCVCPVLQAPAAGHGCPTTRLLCGGGGGEGGQLLGATDAQTAHHATSSTAPAHQPLGSTNAEMAPAAAPAAAAFRKH